MTLRNDPVSRLPIRRRVLPATALLLVLALAGCTDSETPAATGGGAVVAALDTAATAADMVARETFFDGVVEAVNQSTVSAQTSGRVVELPYDVGDHVEKGAVIVRFTATEQRARLQARPEPSPLPALRATPSHTGRGKYAWSRLSSLLHDPAAYAEACDPLRNVRTIP